MTHRWYFWLLYPWALIPTLIGLLLAVVYRATDWRWSDGCIECIGGDRIFGRPGAQTHGFLIVYRDESSRGSKRLRVHERVHVVQCLAGGVFYQIAYVVHFLAEWMATGFRDWKSAYYMVFAERQAYRIQDEYNDGLRPDAWGAK